LNRFTDNIAKAEALSAEIASILRESGKSNKSLTTKDESPWLASRTAPAKSNRKGGASPKQRVAKLPKGAEAGDEASTEPVAKPISSDSFTKPLPVSPELFSRYDRGEIYEKVWKMPIDDVAKGYSITEFTFRRTCGRLWIPLPSRRYMERKAAGQPVAPQPPLPEVQVQRRTKKATVTKR
jgi:hypothetical protein